MSWVDNLSIGERRSLQDAGRIGHGRLVLPADDVTHDPARVVVDGQVWFLCTVCREHVARNRSELDADGRCEACRP